MNEPSRTGDSRRVRRRPLPPRTGARGVVVACACALLAACVLRSTRVEREPLDVEAARAAELVTTPFKAWLTDGEVVEFRDGALFSGDSIFGSGLRHAVAAPSRPMSAVPLDSVVALEVYHEHLNKATTVLLSTAATVGILAVAAVGTAALAVAIFGSCPTVYSASPEGPVLEAETFSYSIAPLFEGRDVDRLAAQPDGGVLRLEVRNEALETHYINHLELLELAHEPDEAAFVDAGGQPVAARDLESAVRVTDRAGRDVSDELAARDERHYRTAPSVLQAASSRDPLDELELVFSPTRGAEAALVLRLRNSLLSTALLYDVMLSDAGPAALDWLGRDLARIPDAVEVGQWYAANTGIRVWVEGEGGPREVVRIPDEGPIAWSEIAVPVPVTPDDSVRIRLTFPADSWRIDRARLAGAVRPLRALAIPPARVSGPGGTEEPAALRAVAADDDERLMTLPGDAFTVEFATSPAQEGTRTYLLASQGYYVEWLRRDWVRPSGEQRAFRPSPGAVDAVFESWRATSGDLEARFEATRLPVR